jgi:flagellar motor protein MotB
MVSCKSRLNSGMKQVNRHTRNGRTGILGKAWGSAGPGTNIWMRRFVWRSRTSLPGAIIVRRARPCPNLASLALAKLVSIILFCSVSTSLDLAQSKSLCEDGMSRETLLANDCIGKNLDPRGQPSESEVQEFLASLAQEVAAITPKPFNNVKTERLVQHLENRSGYYLVFPSSHGVSDTSVEKIWPRLKEALQSAATFLTRHKNLKLEIEVRTDGIKIDDKAQDPNCQFDNNFELSECRAAKIRTLIQDLGYKDIDVIASGDSDSCLKSRHDCTDKDSEFDRQIRLSIYLAARPK